MIRYLYRSEILEALLVHGIRPTERTDPELVRTFVVELYKYELRLLKARLMCKEFRRWEYAGRVVEVRKRYPVLAMRAPDWLERS